MLLTTQAGWECAGRPAELLRSLHCSCRSRRSSRNSRRTAGPPRRLPSPPVRPTRLLARSTVCGRLCSELNRSCCVVRWVRWARAQSNTATATSSRRRRAAGNSVRASPLERWTRGRWYSWAVACATSRSPIWPSWSGCGALPAPGAAHRRCPPLRSRSTQPMYPRFAHRTAEVSPHTEASLTAESQGSPCPPVGCIRRLGRCRGAVRS